ncbi:hypothetical protein EON64_15195, partial [archaeon]
MENDRQNSDISKLNGNFRRTSKFASQLRDRFFVSGVTGGFLKHEAETKDKDKDSDKEVAAGRLSAKQKRYDYQPVIERNQRLELQREAAKLIELEEKLQEIQRLKEARRQRDRQRRKRKLEYTAASTIQAMFRRYWRRQRSAAVQILVGFLRAMAARQAVCNAVWAGSVLRRFAKYATKKWKIRFLYRRTARRLAEQTAQLSSVVGLEYGVGRRLVAEEAAAFSMSAGVLSALTLTLQAHQSISPQ